LFSCREKRERFTVGRYRSDQIVECWGVLAVMRLVIWAFADNSIIRSMARPAFPEFDFMGLGSF
jgi:hypothetical protein